MIVYDLKKLWLYEISNWECIDIVKKYISSLNCFIFLKKNIFLLNRYYNMLFYDSYDINRN